MKTTDKIIIALSDGSELSSYQIREKAKLNEFEFEHMALLWLEQHEIIESRWADELWPRRRLYKLAR